MHRIKFLLFLCLISLIMTSCDKSTAEIPPESEVAASEVEAIVSEAKEKHSNIIFAMDTVMELTVYSENDTVLSLAADRISELESLFSVTLPDSDISRLNSNGLCTLENDTAELMKNALEICESTSGSLDITVYPIVRAWGFTTGEYRIPSDSELKALLENVDYTSLSLNGNDATLSEGMQVDLGSVAKGYTGDVLCDLFRQNGVTSALINLGGNVQTLGAKPNGSKWKIAVQHPTDNENYLGILSIENMAAITSGGYERYFIGEDGNHYCHIINPHTGKPSDNGILSVTVVGESGFLCDALSTALFVMGLDEAKEYWKSHSDFDFIIMTADEKVYITEGLCECFTLSDAYSSLPLTVIER